MVPYHLHGHMANNDHFFGLIDKCSTKQWLFFFNLIILLVYFQQWSSCLMDILTNMNTIVFDSMGRWPNNVSLFVEWTYGQKQYCSLLICWPYFILVLLVYGCFLFVQWPHDQKLIIFNKREPWEYDQKMIMFNKREP